MPFSYYGAKHGLVAKYPPPVGGHIIEPFAGSAAYSVRWATHVDQVTLYDADPEVVALWHRVQQMTDADLDAITEHVANDERTTDPLVGALAGGTTLHATLSGKSRAITPRCRFDWPRKVCPRIRRALPHLHKFNVIYGHYTDAPDVEATWFIDPPYMPILGNRNDSAGNAYRHGAAAIDYAHLGAWCRTRRGLVIVCEQSPADWLPFYPLARQTNGVASSDRSLTRTEVIWRNDAEQLKLSI